MSGIAAKPTVSRRRVAIMVAATATVAIMRDSSPSMAKGIAISDASAAAVPLPAGATDCHCHIFDSARFPYAADRSYTPGQATLDDQKTFHAGLGVSRVVLVQPSVYGTDNRCLVDGLIKLGCVARGIAVIDVKTVTDGELIALQSAGVVGVRVNLEVKGVDRASSTVDAVVSVIRRVAPFGLAVQIYVDLKLVEALAETIAAAPVPIILDHFGGAQARLGLDQPGLATLLRLLQTDKLYVKLSAPYRASRDAPGYEDLAPIAQALIRANPDHLVWGSDWPHTGGGVDRAARRPGDVEPFRTVNIADTITLFSTWASDADTHRRILVDNAARIFRF